MDGSVRMERVEDVGKEKEVKQELGDDSEWHGAGGEELQSRSDSWADVPTSIEAIRRANIQRDGQ